MKESCPGSREITSPSPEIIKCPFCTSNNEIWTDETEIKCTSCKKLINRAMKTTCLDWCPSAKECIGVEKFERIMNSRAFDPLNI